MQKKKTKKIGPHHQLLLTEGEHRAVFEVRHGVLARERRPLEILHHRVLYYLMPGPDPMSERKNVSCAWGKSRAQGFGVVVFSLSSFWENLL